MSNSEKIDFKLPEHVVFYDGGCGFCDRTVQWLYARDRSEFLYFAALESELAQQVLMECDLPSDLDSIVYVQTQSGKSEAMYYSDAIFGILKLLPAPWNWLRVLTVIPRFIRDTVYRVFAKYRITVFGRVDACQIPDERFARRMLS